MKTVFRMAAILGFFLLFMAIPGICFAADSQGLVLHYTFDGDFKDAGGSGMDGSPVGDVTIAKDGMVGGCAQFNHGYLKILNSSSFNVGEQYTVAAWVKVDESVRDGGNTVAMICKAGDESNGENIIWDVYGGPQDMELLQKYKNDTESVDTQHAGYIDCDQKWTHLVFENDGKTLYTYVDGALANTCQMSRPTDEGGALLTSSGDLLIGNDGYGDIFSGKIDDLRVYNYVLSGDEVKALANTGSYSHKIVLELLNTTMSADGKQVQIDPSSTSIYPYTDNGRTLVPIRAIIENMGGKITWDPDKQEADVTLGPTTIKLWINNVNAEVNGQPFTLDVPPKSVEGRTMLPLRFVAEKLGAKVNWDGNTQQITISY